MVVITSLNSETGPDAAFIHETGHHGARWGHASVNHSQSLMSLARQPRLKSIPR